MSAYKNYSTVRFKEGDIMLDRHPFIYRPSIKDKTHIVIMGDRLDTLAFKYYNDSSLWYIIADTNEIENPFEILGLGEELIIPGLV